MDNLQTAVKEALKDPIEEKFQQCLQKWENSLERCIVSEGNDSENFNLKCKKLAIIVFIKLVFLLLWHTCLTVTIG